MINTAKRIICIIMAGIMLSAVFAGCGNNKQTGNTGTDTTAAQSEETAATEGLDVPKDAFYDDAEFVILLTSWMTNTSNPFKYEESEDVMDEAIYKRNIRVEDDFGVVITTITDFTTAGGTGQSRIIKNATSGDNAYDACVLGVYCSSVLAYQGYLYDLKTLPYVDLTKSWWDRNSVTSFTMYDQTYYVAGDISYIDKEYTFSIIFNKTMAGTLNLENLYGLVEQGKWTLDKFGDMVKLVSEDLDGNDVMNSLDRYGLITWRATMTSTLNGIGETIARIENNELVLSLYNERTEKAVQKYIDIISDKNTVIDFQDTVQMSGGKSWDGMFMNGQSLFLYEYLRALTLFRDTELDYGLLPTPKLDEEQDRYYSGLAGYQSCFFCVPGLVSDPEMSGVISEALAYYGKSIITPAYYEKTLVGRYLRDDESEVCLDIIFGNRIFDLGLFYKVGTYYTQLANMIRDRANNFASMYNTYRTGAQNNLDNINRYFYENSDK